SPHVLAPARRPVGQKGDTVLSAHSDGGSTAGKHRNDRAPHADGGGAGALASESRKGLSIRGSAGGGSQSAARMLLLMPESILARSAARAVDSAGDSTAG